MRDLKNISQVYFLGIGGIGMSALARYFNSLGIQVSGYDLTETALTKQLQSEGIQIHFSDDISLLNSNADIVVYTPAVPKTNSEYQFYVNKETPILKRSEVLGIITDANFNICVAGTHGKSTTSCLIAHILRDSGYGCNAFLGAVSANYESNFWSNERKVAVAEADEFDRSFLKLFPDVAVLTSMDPDHLDIYGTPENMEEAFLEFTGQVKPNGLLVAKFGLKRFDDLRSKNIISYSLENENAMAFAKNLIVENGGYAFDVVMPNKTIKNIHLKMGGLHNVENAVAAIVVANHLGIEEQLIKNAIANFKGVKRRFELVGANEETVIIDDYAHHPEELRMLIRGAKQLYPNKKATIVFQPHLFSRTKDLATEFAEVLSDTDEVILLPIYPARELPMSGVTSDLILDKIKNNKKSIVEKSDLIAKLNESKPELLILSGAGDIDKMVQPIKNALIKN